ncbi:PREDICTED: uncharacterized protein LOC104594717 isoform X2 [Nelumbo nucifera]|uniref:Uncharacterized protein LOC104594717 isoform X2 n=1 Tax=Nelumbo nucifera TaxID=4432 RepID=A0A1U7ZIK7_NELNU|nr:PREDICTED: uncharacterized protein LOC104594717 isoform X2 [Nelumbo nucifera]
MALPFQVAAVVASPSYPNSVAWSDENLVAIASGHLVTILNPALLFGPRGLITVPPSIPFPIGVIKKEDLLSGCLAPTYLARETRPCVRSISWSPLGLAPNSGCLLAVCTTEGRVKIYRQPFLEFRAEWVEVVDISDILCDYLTSINFGELEMTSTESCHEERDRDNIELGYVDSLKISNLSKGRKRAVRNSGKIFDNTRTLANQISHGGDGVDSNGSLLPCNKKLITAYKEVVSFPCSIFKQGSPVEVLTHIGAQHIWFCGKIECMDGAKALVRFSELMDNEKQEEWVDLNPVNDSTKNSSVISNTMADQDAPSPKIRPSMNVGNLPDQLFLDKCHGVEEILRIGQVVEAFMNNRWVEGLFMGFNGHALLVKLTGDSICLTLDANTVRVAPLWNAELRAWQVTLLRIKTEKLRENSLGQTSSVPTSEGKHPKRMRENDYSPLLNAGQYASRNAILSSTVVAWSPLLQVSSDVDTTPTDRFNSDGTLLAVGSKSGKISLWRIHEPHCYSTEDSKVSVDMMLIGLLEAHSSWVTAISWGKFACDASNSKVLLTTGSSDGSVKIWLGDTGRLLKSSEVSCACFSLLKEVLNTSPVPVSVLSVIFPIQTLDEMLLAIGKGSGSLEVWRCGISSHKFQKFGSYGAHEHIVTGIAWAFDGRCLYSCGQDNSMHSWILHGNSLHEVPIPSNSFGLKSSFDHPLVYDSCFGLAISPGNLAVAVARSFDADLLDPMYQARTQKAAVEFFWIGGQQVEVSLDTYPDIGTEGLSGFLGKELACWEANILWSLKKYEYIDKPLVLWDAIEALSGFKQAAPKYVERVLTKWISSCLMACHANFPSESTLSCAPKFLHKIHSRQMHILNVICRRLILSELKADIHNFRHHNTESLDGVEDEQLKLWIELFIRNERELLERLVTFSFAVLSSHVTSSANNISIARYWTPSGVAQMEQWIAINHEWVHDQLKLLRAEIKEIHTRPKFKHVKMQVQLHGIVQGSVESLPPDSVEDENY